MLPTLWQIHFACVGPQACHRSFAISCQHHWLDRRVGIGTYRLNLRKEFSIFRGGDPVVAYDLSRQGMCS
jgi:hypothetical protein